jgi:HK97 family phage portal protein
MSFVRSAGQVETVTAAMAAYPAPPMPTYLSIGPGNYATYEQVWRSQPALRTVVGFLARNIAQLPLDVYRRRSDYDRVKDVTHPLARLLEDPLPGSAWTKYRLLSWTVHELCIFDDAYWIKSLVDGQPGVLPVPRRFVQPIGTSIIAPDYYQLNLSAGVRYLDPDQVVHFHGYNPDDPRIGCSPIETLRSILAEEYAATSYREQMWRNGARVGGYIHRPKDAPRWSDGARDRFKRDWQAQYAGDGSGVGGSPLLEDGMEFRPSGVTPREAQYVESRQLTRVEVAVAYYVSPAMLGVMEEGASMANVAEYHKMLYQDTLGPPLVALAQDIERQLLIDLDPGAADGSTYVEFNLAAKLQGSFEEQAAAISASVGGPWMTRSEARARHNLPHLDEADELIVPLNVTAGGLASPRDTAPDNPSNRESNDLPPGPRATQPPKHFLTVGERG